MPRSTAASLAAAIPQDVASFTAELVDLITRYNGKVGYRIKELKKIDSWVKRIVPILLLVLPNE
jgi:hypothetical protein